MTDEEELKARIEHAKNDLEFYSLHSIVLETEWETKEELEIAIDEILNDLIDAHNKLKNIK